MNKREFLNRLRSRLSTCSRQELQERLSFYEEMINDRMEEGKCEAQAIAELGSADAVAAEILEELEQNEEKKTPHALHQKHHTWWRILLWIAAFPILFSLFVAAAAVCLALYVSLWSVIVSFWATFGALVGCAAAGVVAGLVLAVSGDVCVGLALLAAALVCAGLAILLFWGCKAATGGTILLTKTILGKRTPNAEKKEERK